MTDSENKLLLLFMLELQRENQTMIPRPSLEKLMLIYSEMVCMTYVTRCKSAKGLHLSLSCRLVVPQVDAAKFLLIPRLHTCATVRKVSWVRPCDANYLIQGTVLVLTLISMATQYSNNITSFGPGRKLPNTTGLREENKHLSLCLCKILLNQKFIKIINTY